MSYVPVQIPSATMVPSIDEYLRAAAESGAVLGNLVENAYSTQQDAAVDARVQSLIAASGQTIVAVDTLAADHIVVSGDKNHLLRCTASLTITLPNISPPAVIYVLLVGAVTVSFTAGAGMSVFGAGTVTGDGLLVMLVQTDSSTWEVLSNQVNPQTLLTDLVAFWPLDQGTGLSRLDAVGGHTLSQFNTVTAQVGKTRRVSTGMTGTQYLSSASTTEADEKFNFGDADFTLAGWAYLTALNQQSVLVGRYSSGVGKRAYILLFHNVTGRFRFIVSWDGSSANSISLDANTFGLPVTNTWYHVMAWHSAASNQVGISVNTISDTAAWTTGTFSTTGVPMQLGAVEGSGLYAGRLQDVAVWGRVLSEDERALLYNGGSGRTYPFL